jgi:hypothetical protein
MNSGDLHLTGGLHLSSDQMSELLACAPDTACELAGLEASQAHLRVCPACTAEFASLREALLLFQEASIAHADREFGRLRNPSSLASPILPARGAASQTLFWVAASAVLMAGLLPPEVRWQRTLSTPTVATAEAFAPPAESDEALLEDIDRQLSVSVPASMQTLADPTGDASAQTSTQSATQTPIRTSPETSDQRKD